MHSQRTVKREMASWGAHVEAHTKEALIEEKFERRAWDKAPSIEVRPCLCADESRECLGEEVIVYVSC